MPCQVLFQCPSYLEDLFWDIFVLFYSLSGNLLSRFYCTALYDFFSCLGTLRIRGKTAGRVSFDTGNNRLLEREKNSRIFIFLGYGSATADLMLIQST